MFRTKSLSSFKGILPSIHQPLPLDKRAAQQLLDAITSSFRKQLDRAHGWEADVEETNNLPINKPFLTYLPQTSPSPNPSKNANRRPTDQHLRAILSNPLFSYDTTKAPNDVQLERNRDDLFDEAVARGLMTIKRAHGFLLSVHKDIKLSTSSDMQDGMAASGAGLRVLRWLQASGQERDFSFISNRKFTELLTWFLVAEGMSELLWKWFARLVSEDFPSGTERSDTLAVFLKSAAQAESQSMKLDSAFSMVLHGERMLQQSGTPLENVLPAWHHLTWKTTVESWKHSSPSANLFDPFVRIPDHASKPMRIERAHLDLHHPSSPDPTRAIRYLSETERWRKYLPESSQISGRKVDTLDNAARHVVNFTTQLMAMGLDTVQLLLRVGKPEEAQRILDILKSHLFPYYDVPTRGIRHGG